MTLTHASPNFRARMSPIDMIVLHYTGMQEGGAALRRLCDSQSGVSAHYLVMASGEVCTLVDDAQCAFHAGISHWAGRDGVNDCSIGIEIDHPGHEFGYGAFSDVQIQAILSLVRQLMARWSIPKTRIVGHSDVAPERKEDPGEAFPWQALAARELAIGPFQGTALPAGHTDLPDYDMCLRLLRDIGYRVEKTYHTAPVLAFQRRFCPAALGQGLNPLTRTALCKIALLFSRQEQ